MSSDDLVSKAAAAAHRARWLIVALEEAVQVLENVAASDEARREEIAAVDAAWEKLVGGPLKHRGGKQANARYQTRHGALGGDGGSGSGFG